jgi:hypothetical protein
MCEEMVNAVRDFSEEEVQDQRAAQSIDGDDQKKQQWIKIDLLRGHEWERDRRVAEWAIRLLERCDLSETKILEIQFPISDVVQILPHHRRVVDHYISFLLGSVPVGRHLERVNVPFLGRGDGPWTKFLQQFGVDRLEVRMHWTGSDIENSSQARGFVRSLRHLAALPPIELSLSARDAFFGGAAVPVGTAVAHAHDVKICEASDRGTIQTALEGLVGLASLSPSLKSRKVEGAWYCRGPSTAGCVGRRLVLGQ